MSKARVIARLEALLDRVRARAGQPRPTTTAEAGVEPLQAVEDQPARRDIGIAPASAFSESAKASVIEEAPVSDEYESRERIVAAQPASFEAPAPAQASAAAAAAPVAELNRGPVMESSPPIDVAEIEVISEDDEAEVDEPGEAPKDEAEEEPPVSSRRPVLPEPEERLAQMAFGTEEPPPIHTPPPESGRLPAAPEYDADVTRVRTSGTLAPRRTPEPPAPAELVPEPTQVELGSAEAAADVIAAAQQFTPSTFLELLDASLQL